MKMIVVVALALVALAAAAPPQNPDTPAILKSDFQQNPEGGYNYSFETENGIKTNEEGQLKTINDEENKPQTVVVVRGTYSYPDEDGNPIIVTYVADETGFHPEGERIPKPVSK